MTVTLDFILFLVAAICFVLAAVGVKVGNVNLVAAGLFCWVLTNF